MNLCFSDPNLKDADGDGYTDLEEVNAGTSASSSVEYPDWNATLTFYHTPLNAQKVSGGWMNLLGIPHHFLQLVCMLLLQSLHPGNFSNLNGFVYLSNPPQIDPSTSDSDGDGFTRHMGIYLDFPLLKRMGRKIWTEIR